MGSAIYAQSGATQSQDAGAGATGGEQTSSSDGAEDVVDAEIVDEDKK
jgi:molecular chaperone DnaK